MASILNVAQYVLVRVGAMTTMKLQKLVYYCQAWSLAWDDEPLFDEDFEAWANGPVNRSLFYVHQGLFHVSRNFLNRYEFLGFTDSQKETMDIVIRELGDKSPQWLSDLSHSERPWIEARAGYEPGERCENIIDKETMRDYYGGLSA